MKKLFLTTGSFILALGLLGCNGKTSESQETEETSVETNDSISYSADTMAVEQNVETTAEEVSESTSNNWDSVLDEYESFVDEYIQLYKKAKAGDVSAVGEYAECLQKAESLQSKLESAKNELTTAQAARLTKIVNKLSKAVMYTSVLKDKREVASNRQPSARSFDQYRPLLKRASTLSPHSCRNGMYNWLIRVF